MIKFTGLAFTYDPSFTMPMLFPDAYSSPRSPLLITGPSGVGKTTLLHLLGGLLNPMKGSIEIASQDITQLRKRDLDLFRGREIGIVFQKPHFFEALNVMDNLLLAPYFSGRDLNKAKVRHLAKRLHIEHLLANNIRQLSLGEQQRVAIARALINRPSVILADEPTSSLDDGNCQTVLQLLLEQTSLSNACLIIITHDERLKPAFSNCIALS